jgi:hypothetical protein
MSETSAPEVSGARRGADTVFAYLAALLLLGIIVQFFLAGLGTFDLHTQTLEKSDGFEPHEALGHILAGVSLLMLIAALVARTSKFAIWGSLALVVLIEVVQVVLAANGKDHAWVGGLHALDGVIILGLAGSMHMRSRAAFSRS